MSLQAGTFRFVDAPRIRSLVGMADAIESSAVAFRALARGEIGSPRRARLSRERALLMSAEHFSGSAVVKLISLDGEGWSKGRASMDGVVAWLDAETGRATTLIDAAALTSLRTGAASGLASSLLARADASVLAVLGAGGLAADQVAAVCAVRPIAEVRIWSRNRARSEALCAALEQARHEAQPEGDRHGSSPPRARGRTRFVVAPSSREAVRHCDVVCAATRAVAPLFEPEDLAPHAHVNAVGAYRHDMCELPAGAFAAASVVAVDEVEAALAEAGDVMRAIESGMLSAARLVTLAELLPGGPAGQDGDKGRAGVTIFKSVGVAAQDWALADLVVRRDRERR